MLSIFAIKSEIVSAIVAHMAARGYTFVTIPKILGMGSQGGAQVFRLDSKLVPKFL